MSGRSFRDRDKDDLTLRESLFVANYLLNKGNGSEAVRSSGYKGDANKRARQLLLRPHVQAVIERERNRLLEKFEVKKERVLRELCRVAFLDVRALFNADGSLTQINELNADSAAAIAGVDYKSGGVIKIRFSSKIAALELLGRWLKLWEGSSDSQKDRLQEVIDAMRGPVEEPPTIQ
jgi:phage terminase small subunit